MSRSSVELEIKLGADPELAIPDFRDLVRRTVRLPEQKLFATYFDTADLRLWVRGITLRHRIGEDVPGGLWTLKLPLGGGGAALKRTEIEFQGMVDSVPDEIRDIVLGVVRGAPLRPVTSLETVRRRLVLQGPKKRLLAEVDDDLVTIHGGVHDGERFRQIEIELDEAPEKLLERCARRLRHAGAWSDDRGPKLARALDEAVIEKGCPDPVTSKSTISAVVMLSLRTGLDRILDHEYLLRLGDFPAPEAVHQMRVGSRRLRSDLQTFASLLDPVWTGHVRRDLKWLGEALGRVRDADVLEENLGLNGRFDPADATGSSGLYRDLRLEREDAVRNLATVINSERYLRLLDTLHAASELPPFLVLGSDSDVKHPSVQMASKVLPRIVERRWKRLRREVRRAGREPSARQLHKIRIKAKELRYAAEASEAVVGKRSSRTARAAERLQTELGTHHDAVVAEKWLCERARGAAWQVAFSAGRLAADQHRVQQRVRDDWFSHWKRMRRQADAWLG